MMRRSPLSGGRLVLLLAVALLAGLPARAQEATSDDAARWERRAQNITITRDDWGIPHVYGEPSQRTPAGRLGTAAADTVRVAPPTGETNADRASILAALERASPGGTVLFAPGTYLVGELIRLETPRLTLLGHPEGTVLRGCHPEQYEANEREALLATDAATGWRLLGQCGMLELTGGHVTVRNFTFEYSRLGLVLGCCEGEDVLRSAEGGYRIEANTFRNSGNSIRATLSSPEPTVIRGNRFINTFHALSGGVRHVHMLDNEISVPEPGKVPGAGHPGFAIGVRPPYAGPAGVQSDAPRACEHNIIAGNRIVGHTDGITLVALPGTSCRDNTVRGNTIEVRRVPIPDDWVYADVVPLPAPGDSTLVGVPLALVNIPVRSGSTAEGGEEGRLEDNLVEGNRIMGADGLGIEVLGASRTQIVSNTITGVRRRDPFPGNTTGGYQTWGDANGSGIWVSPGSDENEITGNTFEDIAAYAVVLEGDRNRVKLRSAGDSVLDLGADNEMTGFVTGDQPDTVFVAPPTGERAADRASILTAGGEVDPGGIVVFAPGTYVVGGLNLDIAVPGITLLGHPDGTTIRGCDPEVFGEFEVATRACNAFSLSGGHQTVRGFTFEYAWTGITVGCCLPTDVEQLRSGAWRPEPTRPGGDIIEGNTFRYTPNGLRVLGRSAERTVIRENQFVDVYHAIGINGGGVDFLDNRIYTDQPHRVPTSTHPGDAINISPAGGPGDHTTCSDNVVAGNRIEGYTHGIRIGVHAPDTSCRRNIIRDNTIAVRRVPFVTDWFGIQLSDEADSTVVGIPLGLINYPMIEPGGDGRPEAGRIPVIEDNVIDGNEITGGYGLGIEVAHASRNRIVNNSIRGIRAREPFPGNVLSEPVLWAKANGAGIWLSPGSDGNEIVGNTFEDIAASAVVIEGDDNLVETRSPDEDVRDLGSGNRVLGSAGAAAPPLDHPSGAGIGSSSTGE